MLFNLTSIVHSGIIDNTQRGVTKLTLCTKIGKYPVQVHLAGDCLGEASGRRTSFRANDWKETAPEPARIRAYRHVVNLLEKSREQLIMGDIAVLTGKTAADRDELVIEFFHCREMRFLIEGAKYSCELSTPVWNTKEEEEEKQKMLNLLALRNHVSYNANYFNGPTMQPVSANFPFCKWDYILNRAEGYNTITQTLWHRYPDTPHGRLRLAYVLGLIRSNNRQPSKGKKKKNHSGEKSVQMPGKGRCSLADFLLPQENEIFMEAVKMPLCRAAFSFTVLVQRELVKLPRTNQSNAKSESIYADVSSFSGHLLATLMLLVDDEKELDVVQKRLHELLKFCKKLHRFASYLSGDVQGAYSNTLCLLQDELQNFIASHKE